MEALLLQSDIGPALAAAAMQQMRAGIRQQGLTRSEEAQRALRDYFGGLLGETPSVSLAGKPCVILIVGVNGSGKTTTIAKLAQRFAGEGKRVMLGAADTYRAAAA
jgi:fused signal recognition particle receptor